ncbi:tetratricopeptide repeat protein [Polynucleobacter sp. CS-Odin-A6]|uniref:tetratricopeptide repeat protein n=1 Tax=Polynucleobacter sp. CS-Odin-A6 TaxID=2689106 RepID=UPI001C0C4D23|nr:tetratricopeptide repeat protein [Polynucleobacter sp. CS-Odin-A6]MBU3621911.1 tetratricopeptide repeat protein [Polynucleobacter sp. CS-Odin-A6]
MENKNLHGEFLIVALLFVNLALGQTLLEDIQYKKALELNKSARYIESAALLKSLMISYPATERYKSDFISVASNAELCEDVIAMSNRKYIAKAPAYVQNAIFSCYANTQDFSKVDALAKSILKIQGTNRAIELRMTALAREKKESDSALYWSARFLKDYPNSMSAWELRAGALQDVGDQFAALQIYEDIRRFKPHNPNTQERIIQVLLDMGIPHLAVDLINKKQWKTNQDQKLRAIHDSGAVDLRWAQADSAVAPNRFTSVDTGIETLNNSLAYAKSIQAPKDQIASIQYDLIIAYTKRKQWDKSLALYDELISGGSTVPDYALSAVAASYSAKYQYAKAGNILQKLYAKKPDDLDIQLDMYFNLVDQDQFTEAKPVLDKLTAQLKVRPKYLPKRDFNYTSAVIEAVSFEAYQEKYQEANKKLLPLLGTIPSNADLLKTAASLRESEGMHQSAADYYQIAARQDPEDIEAKIGYANSRMSQGDIPTFISTVNELTPGYSDINAVKNASNRLDIYKEGYVTGNFVVGNGDYGSQKNNNRTSDLRVYSAPINDNLRGFARYRDLNSGPAIPVTDQGVGGGLRYTGINQEAEVEVGNAGYARVEGIQTLNDNWVVGASYERNAFYLFPGSLYATYGGNVVGLDLKWKDADTRSAALGYRYWTLPSNNRQQIFGTVSQRLLTEFNYKLDISGWIGSQQNSNSNVSYFSPVNQTEYSSTLNLRFLQWRDIETKKYDFWHRFYGSYGVVTQSGYSTLPMNNYGYGQDFNIGDKRMLSWGVGKTSFPFNGAKSSYITGYLNFESRF